MTETPAQHLARRLMADGIEDGCVINATKRKPQITCFCPVRSVPFVGSERDD